MRPPTGHTTSVSQRLGPLDVEVASCRLEQENVVIELIGRHPILVIQNPDDNGLVSLSHTESVQTRCDKKHSNQVKSEKFSEFLLTAEYL